ncbi:unnamed protein product [Orchesella dallaii]|uniref:Uncharacterized protein n=1 Tax=Orchesella dallaii TaxID=48710 RepID=A0ABP1RE25_9HEXA
MKGGKVNALSRGGTSPFMFPFRRARGIQDLKVLKVLEDSGAKITKNMCNEVILRLFERKQDSFLEDWKSSEKDKLLLFQFLKERGGNFHFRLRNGETLLHLACEKGWDHVVKWLVEDCRLDVNAKDNQETLPIHCLYNPTCNIARYLVENGSICLPHTEARTDSFLSLQTELEF